MWASVAPVDGVFEAVHRLVAEGMPPDIAASPERIRLLVSVRGFRDAPCPRCARPLGAHPSSREVARWLQAFRSRAGFDARRGGARGWLYGVAHNVLRAHWRTARPGPETTAGVWDEWAAVDARLDSAAVAPRLRAALADLPPDERELLLLTTWEQLTPSEAAVVVGIPAATARTRLHRARRRLRDDLASDPRVAARRAALPTGDLA